DKPRRGGRAGRQGARARSIRGRGGARLRLHVPALLLRPGRPPLGGPLHAARRLTRPSQQRQAAATAGHDDRLLTGHTGGAAPSFRGMKAITYDGPFHVRLRDKPFSRIEHPQDAILRVTAGGSAAPTSTCCTGSSPTPASASLWATRWSA